MKSGRGGGCGSPKRWVGADRPGHLDLAEKKWGDLSGHPTLFNSIFQPSPHVAEDLILDKSVAAAGVGRVGYPPSSVPQRGLPLFWTMNVLPLSCT